MSLPQAPSPKEENEPKKVSTAAPPSKAPAEPKKTSSTASAPSTTPEPTLKKTHPYERPQTSGNYGSVKSTKKLSKIGIALALILLAGVAGTLGFWYHDFLESHIPILQRQSDTPPQGTSLPQTMPVERDIAIASPQDSLDIQEPLVETIETVDPPKNDPQPLSMQKEPGINPLSHQTPPSREFDIKPNQPNITRTPKAGQAQSLVPVKKQPDSNPSPAPVKQQPSTITPPVQEMAPLATTKATKKGPLKSPASPQSTEEAIPIKAESTQSATSSEEMNREPSDGEFEELLQSLDAPTADLPLITEP